MNNRLQQSLAHRYYTHFRVGAQLHAARETEEKIDDARAADVDTNGYVWHSLQAYAF